MRTQLERAGLVSAIVALIAVTACNKGGRAEIDPSLKADLAAVGGGEGGNLELAPTSSKSMMVVSPIEGGPTAAPKKASTVRTPRPTVKQAPRVAQSQRRVEAPAPSQVAVSDPAPVTAEPEQPAIQAPRPAPAPAPREDHRVYKTEAEIFRQMPWIRP
jgi:hypothetical protein